jgi:hypothetical protein
LLSGQVNLSVALRTCQLRYCDTGVADFQVPDRRISVLAYLQGRTTSRLRGALRCPR